MTSKTTLWSCGISPAILQDQQTPLELINSYQTPIGFLKELDKFIPKLGL